MLGVQDPALGPKVARPWFAVKYLFFKCFFVKSLEIVDVYFEIFFQHLPLVHFYTDTCYKRFAVFGSNHILWKH